MLKINNKQSAFTIVELLIVIVVIAILATITIVVFNGAQDKARKTALVADLDQAAKQLKLDQVESGLYPTSKARAADGKGLKASAGTSLEYDADNSTSPPGFCLTAVSGKHAAYITQEGNAKEGTCPGHSGPAAGRGEEGITIGSQTWAKKNVNVGTMVSGSTTQTDNGTVEKYCYNNDEANCETYGALYQWNEAMQYSSKPGARGVCPAGWYIPTEEDFRALEASLGMTEAQINSSSWRGTDQGAKLKSGGSTGMNIPLGGYKNSLRSFQFVDSEGYLWSSSLNLTGTDWPFARNLSVAHSAVRRTLANPSMGVPVRCLKN